MKSYDQIYRENPDHPWTFDDWEETKLIVGALDSWEGKRVLDIGCGTGDLAVLLSQRFALVSGLDSNNEAISCAKLKYAGLCQPANPSLFFSCSDYHHWPPPPASSYDIITMKGVLEHVEGDPFEELKWIMDNLLKNDGVCIVTCPNWLNARGFILLTMAYLYNEPITRADRHYLFPHQFIDFADKEGLKLDYWTGDFQWAWGDRMVRDLHQRLPKIFDAKKEIQIRRFMKEIVEPYSRFFKIGYDKSNLTGAVACYKLWRESE